MRMRWAGFLLLSLCVVAGYAWRAQFSVDLTDEPFYLAPAWKLFSLGDRPFHDEIYNGPRHSDLLNAVLVAGWLPYQVLTLRVAAILLYGAVLLAYVIFWFRSRVGLLAALCYGSLLIFDVFLMPTWSYNWWCRNFILLSLLFYFLALRNKKGAWIFLSGACLGGAVVAYLPVVVGAVLLLGFAAYHFWKSDRRFFSLLALGFALAVLPDWIYCLRPANFGAWWSAVQSLSSLGYASVSSFSKLWILMSYVSGALSFSLGLAALFLFYRPIPVQGRWKLGVGALIAGMLILLGSRSDFWATLRFYVGLSVACGLWLSWQWRKEARAGAVLSALAVAFLMGMASVNQTLALFWVLPAVLVPAMAEASRTPALLQRGLLYLVMGFIGLGAFQYQRTTSYYDVPPGNCARKLTTPPLQGLKTSEERVQLIEEIAHFTEGKNFVLSFADFPGPFYFSVARSAVDTVMVEADAPRSFHLRSLQHMVDRQRVPELIIHTKVNPWYWGVHHPLADTFFLYPSSDPYIAFTDCVAAKTLVERREYRIVLPDATKVESCVREIALTEGKLANPSQLVVPETDGS